MQPCTREDPIVAVRHGKHVPGAQSQIQPSRPNPRASVLYSLKYGATSRDA